MYYIVECNNTKSKTKKKVRQEHKVFFISGTALLLAAVRSAKSAGVPILRQSFKRWR